MEQKIDLRDALQQLGIKNIFTKEADLSAMTAETEGVCVFVFLNISQSIKGCIVLKYYF